MFNPQLFFLVRLNTSFLTRLIFFRGIGRTDFNIVLANLLVVKVDLMLRVVTGLPTCLWGQYQVFIIEDGFCFFDHFGVSAVCILKTQIAMALAESQLYLLLI